MCANFLFKINNLGAKMAFSSPCVMCVGKSGCFGCLDFGSFSGKWACYADQQRSRFMSTATGRSKPGEASRNAPNDPGQCIDTATFQKYVGGGSRVVYVKPIGGAMFLRQVHDDHLSCLAKAGPHVAISPFQRFVGNVGHP
jgi:predicted Fe-S protein YdhL (DUF1289 family)